MSDEIAISMGGVSWDHLRYTSPGSLADDELGNWGYEPSWAGVEFVAECRHAVCNPTEILSAGLGRHFVILCFPTHHHAESCLRKLADVGRFRMRPVFSREIREEGRCFCVSAARGRQQLRRQR